MWADRQTDRQQCTEFLVIHKLLNYLGVGGWGGEGFKLIFPQPFATGC